MAIMEDSADTESLFKYVPVDKREKKEFHKKISQLEKKLKEENEVIALKKSLLEEKKTNAKLEEAHQDLIKRQKDELQKNKLEEKQACDLGTEETNAVEKLGDQKNLEIVEKFDELLAQLREKEEYFEDLRNDLIIGLKDRPYGCRIGVRWMGELDIGPFLRVMGRRYIPAAVAEERAAEEYSLWETYIRDPKWYPIKTIAVNGINEEVIDPEDEKLKALKKNLGDEVYEAVTTALTEANLYNPSKRTAVLELWNYHEGRKATAKEGITYILTMFKLKNRRLPARLPIGVEAFA